MFLVDNETAYEYVYNSTKELFDFYVDMFKYNKFNAFISTQSY